MLDPVSRIRRFNRAVTAEVGALDNSFLGRGRPLGAARVLNAIGQGRGEVAELRDYLGLDSGLASRLLRGLEEEGLITTKPHPDDARRRIAKLTSAGRREFDAYETLSNARAEPRSEAARYCLGEYYAELSRRFEGGFEVALSRDPDASDMIAPRGAFFVAMSDGMPLGCVGLKGGGEDYAEIKRLWVAPSARGLGIARRLMDAAEEAARNLSIELLRLDTNSALTEAGQLYRSTGWTEIARFNDDPYPDLFFEKRL